MNIISSNIRHHWYSNHQSNIGDVIIMIVMVDVGDSSQVEALGGVRSIFSPPLGGHV